MLGDTWSNESPIARAERYVDIPKDAARVSVTKYYDWQLGIEVCSLRYTVSVPHKHWIVIKLDASTGELLSYYDTSKRCTERVSTDVRIDLDEAKERAMNFISRVMECQGDLRLAKAEFLHREGCEDRMFHEYRFEWSRLINGIEVMGENNLLVLVHASSGEVVVYDRQLFGEPPSNTEARISKEKAVELGREHLLEGIRNSTSPIASQAMEAILRAEVSEAKLTYVRFKLSSVNHGLAPKGLWLCWIVKFTYTEVPEGLELLRGNHVVMYVQATTGEIIHMGATKLSLRPIQC